MKIREILDLMEEFTPKKYYYRNHKSSLYSVILEDTLYEIEFQNRWELITNTDITNHVKDVLVNPTEHCQVYQNKKDSRQIIIVDREGPYYVVDHAFYNEYTDELYSGMSLNTSSKPNIGFFSTIISLYIDLLSKGYPVKISAVDEDMWKSYRRVLLKIAKRYPNYYVSDVEVKFDDEQRVNVYSVVVIPKGKLLVDSRNILINRLKEQSK
jgi:hypothetical protein